MNSKQKNPPDEDTLEADQADHHAKDETRSPFLG
jgi:hypothetical protein